MTLTSFEQSIKDNKFHAKASVYLQALWYDAQGEWDKAHSLIDNLTGNKAAAVHAYLHRVEGDNVNANYWYSRAGRKMPNLRLKEEWILLVKEFME
jgi:hypothetical protein